MKVAFANDHGGLEMRGALLEVLNERGIQVVDFGTTDEAGVDYPDVARLACESIVNGGSERAVLVCGSGIGISIAANKIRGIRCALCHDEYDAVMSRKHNDANALALRGREFDVKQNVRILKAWLDSDFDDAEGRHARRIRKIGKLEE
jgi:ribose 5-phosphate isomerase B